MRILIVSSYLPYPLFSGGHIRLYNLVKELSLQHEITLVCEKRGYQKAKDEEEVAKFCKKVVTVSRIKQWSIANILKTGFSFKPFLITGHTNKLMQGEITKLLEKEKFDLIHAETSYIMQNIPKTLIPIVLTEHNIEYLVYKKYLNQGNPILKPVLYIDILKLKYWEKIFWKRAKCVIAVSEEEKEIFKKEGISHVFVVPNGVDTNKFKIQFCNAESKFKINEGRKILFLGDFKWIKNIDAATWLIKEIWPFFMSLWGNLETNNDIKLWIIGRKIPLKIKELGENDPKIIFDENAPSKTEEIFKQAELLVAPIRVGGGTSFKILEAMAMGIPVVTTKSGIEGIRAEGGIEVLIAESPQDIAKGICDLLRNRDEAERISKNARKLIFEKYSWDKIIKDLEKAYNFALKQ